MIGETDCFMSSLLLCGSSKMTQCTTHFFPWEVFLGYHHLCYVNGVRNFPVSILTLSINSVLWSSKLVSFEFCPIFVDSQNCTSFPWQDKKSQLTPVHSWSHTLGCEKLLESCKDQFYFQNCRIANSFQQSPYRARALHLLLFRKVPIVHSTVPFSSFFYNMKVLYLAVLFTTSSLH